MHITVDTIIGLFALLSAFGIYFLDVRHKLDTLIERHEGILSKEQAHDLAEIYRDMVGTHLGEALMRYAQNDLPNQYDKGDTQRIMSEFRRAYDRIVTKSVRPLVKSFRLRGNHRFDDLVTRASRDSLLLGFESIKSKFEAGFSNKRPLHDVIRDVQDIMSDVGHKGKELILKEIDILYPRRSDA